jgi:predicted ATP-grasp superfamily ATP-dependent carboligase
VGLAGPRRSRSARSRHVAARHVVPAAEHGLEAFAAAVAQTVRSADYDLVLGADDVEVLALSSVRDEIPARIPYAPDPLVRAAFDKTALTHAADTVGIATPQLVTPDADPGAVSFPVVVKARLHWTPGALAPTGRLSAAVCRDPRQLSEALATVRAGGGEPVIQQAVAGDLMAMTLLIGHDGDVLARVQQRALAVSPYLRTSVRGRTEPVDPDLAERVAALLRRLGWLGLANLQFLAPPDGPPRLIDFNGRIYGSIALAIRAGVDFPARWAHVAMGGRDAGPLEARPGVRYQALEEDLRRVRAERRGRLLTGVVDCLRFAPGAAHSTWRVSDPQPALARALWLARGRQASADQTSSNTA